MSDYTHGLVPVVSKEIRTAQLLVPVPLILRVYIGPWLIFYPLAAYAYYVKYDEWIQSIEWSFLLAIALYGGHTLSFLVTKWNLSAKAYAEARVVTDLTRASQVKVVPHEHRGEGEIVRLTRELRRGAPVISFQYQRDTYQFDGTKFAKKAYPCDTHPALSTFQKTKGLNATAVKDGVEDFGRNTFDIPVPTFLELFYEHAVAPFFVFQVFCAGLWFMDEYWYYSLFTLFMLVAFECTTVFQRLRTIKEFRSMSVQPFPIRVFREGKWKELSTTELVPGDLVALGRTPEESGVPADLVVVAGSAIVNEAMLSGESTPLLKESIELREASDKLDVEGADKNNVLFGGTSVLQTTASKTYARASPTDNECLCVVLRTGFGTTQGQLIRTMIFSPETVGASNLEAFLFIGLLLIFALLASGYVWKKGVEFDRKRSKLLLDCVLIITSVVPPELPMELSVAVNSSLTALGKLFIFCTEPHRIPFAGKVDVCCFDKTGTITDENLRVEGVHLSSTTDAALSPLTQLPIETTLVLAAAHALVLLDNETIGDPMEKNTLDALQWHLSSADKIVQGTKAAPQKHSLNIARRFQFSSALKRMSALAHTTSLSGDKQLFAAVKGAPETIKGMLSKVPDNYDAIYRGYAQKGARVLALAYKVCPTGFAPDISQVHRDDVESQLTFAGFLVFSSPLKPDAVQVLKELIHASHRCIMITGDNPLTAVHVARQVYIVDQAEAKVLDLEKGTLVWRTILDDVTTPITSETDLLADFDFDICATGPALQFLLDNHPQSAWLHLVQRIWVYARVTPTQKEYILNSLRKLGYITLMAGDGTNDVGALKQAHVGIALLNGSEEGMRARAEHQRKLALKKVYEAQLRLTARFNQPPPPVPPLIADMIPDAVGLRQRIVDEMKRNPSRNKLDFSALTDSMSGLEDDEEVPKLKLGDASVAAPFTSKLSHVSAITSIIRQGRSTLVATIQMYKILALNCLISAYALSVQYLQGIKFGDYQVTITGLLMSVCFMCISRARPIERLSRERPLSTIFNVYVVPSILIQFAIHTVSMLYLTYLCELSDPIDMASVDLEAKFSPSLLNSAIYLLSLSQQVSTFAVNFQGRPFREGITENSALYYGLLGVSGVAFSGATNFFPEFNSWLQLVDMSTDFRTRLSLIMLADFALSWIVDIVLKHYFADNKPKPIITFGIERRERREAEEAQAAAEASVLKKDN